jgi:hypothetical protein
MVNLVVRKVTARLLKVKNHCSPSTKLHGLIFQKTVISAGTAKRALDITSAYNFVDAVLALTGLLSVQN